VQTLPRDQSERRRCQPRLAQDLPDESRNIDVGTDIQGCYQVRSVFRTVDDEHGLGVRGHDEDALPTARPHGWELSACRGNGV
jgi:hypothetical protein